MAIDILFIIMATFGFYFGFSFGLMKVALMVLSLCLAVLAAMAFTPMTTNIIIDTFEVNSVFLPFVAFLVTLLIVLMLARIITKLIEETVDNKRFDMISQVIGGLVMGLVFTLLYSVLVIFFGQAGVVKLIFNKEGKATFEDTEIQLVASGKSLGIAISDTIYMRRDGDNNSYQFMSSEETGAASLNFGFSRVMENEYMGFVRDNSQQWDMLPGDTVHIRAKGQLYLMVEEEMRCFCDSSFLIESHSNTIHFQCTDDYLAAKSTTSFFYKYIEVIPQRGMQLMKGMAPFIKNFVNYMTIALERLDDKMQSKDSPINVYSKEDTKEAVQPVEEESLLEPEEEMSDTLNISIDTTNIPSPEPTIDTVSNQEEIEPEEEDVEYEG